MRAVAILAVAEMWGSVQPHTKYFLTASWSLKVSKPAMDIRGYNLHPIY